MELHEAVEALNKGFDEFKAANDTRLAEIEKRGSADVVTTEKVDRIASEIAELKGTIDAIDRASASGVSPTGEGKDQEIKSFEKAIRYKKAFEELEGKAMDADFSNNTTSGGVLVPETIAAQILGKIKDISPFRQYVRVTQVGSPNYERLVDEKGTASGWAGESTTRSETGTTTIQRVTFTHGELYAVPKVSNWILNDAMTDVTALVVDGVAEEMAFQEGVAIVSGNGTNKPTGFATGSPAATGDEDSPARAFGTLEYIPTGAAGAFPNDQTGSPVGNPGDPLITTMYKLKAGYRANARWAMNRSTLATVMKFKDADGNYLWRPGLAAGQPDTLLGYPVFEAEAMADIGSNSFPIAFGDFFAGYEMIDIVGMRMIRDDVTAKGHTLFYVSRRLGGKVVNDDAIKLVKAAAS